MSLTQITKVGVESALAEFQALGREDFLSKYGFGKGRSYFLVHHGHRYDSKAICGAAHGYDFPDEGPLRSLDFNGGALTVQRHLEHLGFEVVTSKPKANSWTEEERVLALDLYLRVGLAGKTTTEVTQLSGELNERGFHPDAGSRSDFRNPSGVALKLANFASLDPSHVGAGMNSFGSGDEQTWERFAGDEDRLAAAVLEIRAGRLIQQRSPKKKDVVPRRTRLEALHKEEFLVDKSGGQTSGRRSEAKLVLAFGEFLSKQLGREVAAHEYELGEVTLRSDLADETEKTLWEAKSRVSREAIRMALGQLIDYGRFEPEGWSSGVLLPRRPNDDLLELIRSAGARVAWQVGTNRFVIQEDLNSPNRPVSLNARRAVSGKE